MKCCPVCGARTITRKVQLSYEGFTRSQAKVLDLLAQNAGALVTIERFLDHLYGHRADGGPLNAAEIVRVHIYHIKRKLISYGANVVIENEHGRGYRLVTVERMAAE